MNPDKAIYENINRSLMLLVRFLVLNREGREEKENREERNVRLLGYFLYFRAISDSKYTRGYPNGSWLWVD